MPAIAPIILPTETPYGIKEYRTEIGVMCVDVNFRADPAKRSDSAIRDMKMGKPLKVWKTEFEGDWSMTQGTPVASEFRRETHVTESQLRAQAGQTITVGWDWGLNPAVVFGQINDGQHQILRAVHPTNISLLSFGPIVLANMYTEGQLRQFFPKERLDKMMPPMTFSQLFPPELLKATVSLSQEAGSALAFRHVGDPAGGQRSANTGEHPLNMVKRLFGIVVTKKTNNWTQRVNALDYSFMLGAECAPGVPLVVISSGLYTEYLIDGLSGGYAFPETGDKDTPVKGAYSHPQDALQYVLLDWFPPGGAGKAVSQSQTESYSAVLNPNAAAPHIAPAPLAEGEEPLDPIIIVDGLPTLRNGGGWNPFLQSLLG